MSSRNLGGVQGVSFLGVFEFSRQNGGDETNWCKEMHFSFGPIP